MTKICNDSSIRFYETINTVNSARTPNPNSVDPSHSSGTIAIEIRGQRKASNPRASSMALLTSRNRAGPRREMIAPILAFETVWMLSRLAAQSVDKPSPFPRTTCTHLPGSWLAPGLFRLPHIELSRFHRVTRVSLSMLPLQFFNGMLADERLEFLHFGHGLASHRGQPRTGTPSSSHALRKALSRVATGSSLRKASSRYAAS